MIMFVIFTSYCLIEPSRLNSCTLVMGEIIDVVVSRLHCQATDCVSSTRV